MMRCLVVMVALFLLALTTSESYAQCVNGRCYNRSFSTRSYPTASYPTASYPTASYPTASYPTASYPTASSTGQQIIYVKRCVNGRCYYEAQVVGNTTIREKTVTTTSKSVANQDELVLLNL